MISGTTFLAAIAFYFVIIEEIPKVSYPTRCDLWNGVNFCLLFLSSLENVVACMYLKNGWIEETSLELVEHRAAVVYLFCVFSSAAWFIWPVFDFERDRRNSVKIAADTTK